LDWTDFDADKQATIMLSLITDHGRATPLVWLTVDKRTLKDNRSLYEHRVLIRLAELLSADIKVCVVADRGFGDQKLYRMLTEELRFDYVIRFRGDITVTATTGETRTAAAWVRPGGRARVLRGAAVTADHYAVGTVVCVQHPDMKQAWCLAASSTDATAKHLTGYYGRRWGIECALRDTKDLRFGMGMGVIHVKAPERRDRLWLINAFAVVLLTLLGAAGEALGYDRMLKTNTAKRRVHSLFRQGCMLYDLIPTMPQARLGPHSSPHFPWDTKESVGGRDDSGKNRVSAGVGISLRIRQDAFYRRADQQISRPAAAGRGIQWSSGSSDFPTTRFGRSLAACWTTTCTPSASTRCATPPSACCTAP